MRPGHSAGRTRLTQDISAYNRGAWLDVHRGEMGEQRKHTESVIDDDGVPRKIQISRHHDSSRIGSHDRRSGRRAEVTALMPAGRLAVGDC